METPEEITGLSDERRMQLQRYKNRNKLKNGTVLLLNKGEDTGEQAAYTEDLWQQAFGKAYYALTKKLLFEGNNKLDDEKVKEVFEKLFYLYESGSLDSEEIKKLASDSDTTLAVTQDNLFLFFLLYMSRPALLKGKDKDQLTRTILRLTAYQDLQEDRHHLEKNSANTLNSLHIVNVSAISLCNQLGIGNKSNSDTRENTLQVGFMTAYKKILQQQNITICELREKMKKKEVKKKKLKKRNSPPSKEKNKPGHISSFSHYLGEESPHLNPHSIEFVESNGSSSYESHSFKALATPPSRFSLVGCLKWLFCCFGRGGTAAAQITTTNPMVLDTTAFTRKSKPKKRKVRTKTKRKRNPKRAVGKKGKREEGRPKFLGKTTR